MKIQRGNTSALAWALFLALLAATSAVRAESDRTFDFQLPGPVSRPPAQGVTLYVTDAGINQNRPNLYTGDDFGGYSALTQVLPEIPKCGQVLVVMPDEARLNGPAGAQLENEIFESLKARVDGGLAVGNRAFEVRLVQDINGWGYPGEDRQEFVNRFGVCAYGAIRRLNDYLVSKQLQPDFIAVMGSNGGKVFTENVAAWKGTFHQAIFFDARAFRTPVIETIRELGAKNVTIVNTRGDFPAPPILAQSIACHDVARGIQKQNPELNVFLLNNRSRPNFPTEVHVSGMTKPADIFQVERITTAGRSDAREMTGRDFLRGLLPSGATSSGNIPFATNASPATGFREYWCDSGHPGAQTEANTMAGMAAKSNPQRIVIVADNEQMVGAMRPGLSPGADVLVMNRMEWLAGGRNRAQSWNADVVLGVRSQDNFPRLPAPRLDLPRKTERYESDNDFPDPPEFHPVPMTYEGAEEDARRARERSHEINKLRDPAPYGFPGKGPADGVLSADIGGVMLSNTARVGGDGSRVDVSGGRFSLIVDGRNAQLDATAYRKFITALWAVYYSKESPGISIDPIAPGVDKHMVRYIGKVVNTDLGRVMREADYLMKKWAVGTERADVPGFMDPDEISEKNGVCYVGASSRFWFVPEDMRFKQGGGMLLFDGGRMTVKTEFRFQNDQGLRADPANEQFARFLTDQYPQFSMRYPVLDELFEYAKIVSLAKYLKQNGIPLLWFLMANKDLALTEDSPGTVDALAKGSDHFAGIRIEGGVDLACEGSYVFDPQAVDAIRAAFAGLPAEAASAAASLSGAGASAPPPAEFAFDLGEQSYSVLPQDSLTRGTDSRGLRYQTDLALRVNGEPGLELVRYYDPDRQEGGEFGKGWRLMVPYRVKPADDAKREFLNVMLPERMEVDNLLTGEKEVLVFSTDRYTIAGYVPDQLAASQVVGLFIMSDASFRLADKLGNEFRFDPAGRLTDMIFSEDHQVHIDYLDSFHDAMAQAPCRIEPEGEERAEHLGLSIPKAMKVTDLVRGDSEILTFGNNGGLAAYYPQDGAASPYKLLAPRINGTFRLLNKNGNEIALDSRGEFDDILFEAERPLVAAVSSGPHKVEFKYTLDGATGARIASASVSGTGDNVAPACVLKYEYDADGCLCRVSRSTDTQVARSD
jgi:hypothetical protein